MNIESWVNEFETEKNYFDYKVDALETNSKVLLPGRFYILRYKPNELDKGIINTRPFILSLGISKKDPESFLCIDLCLLPRQIRMRFVQMFYDMFSRDIEKNIKECLFVELADKQSMITEFNYKNLSKIDKMYPIMNAIKLYKIKNTLKIYSLLYSDIYKVVGKFADENWFINGTVADAQKDFLNKTNKKRVKK